MSPQVFESPAGRVEVAETSGWMPFWLMSYTSDGAVYDQAFARTSDEVTALVADMTAELDRIAPKAVA